MNSIAAMSLGLSDHRISMDIIYHSWIRSHLKIHQEFWPTNDKKMCLVPGKCTTSRKLHADIFQRSRLDMAILLPRIIASYCICGHTKCHTWAKIPPLLDVEGPALHSTTRRFRDLCLRSLIQDGGLVPPKSKWGCACLRQVYQEAIRQAPHTCRIWQG